MRILKIFILFIFAVYAAICILLFMGQRKALYIPPAVYAPPSEQGLPNMQDIQFMIGGKAAASWYAAPRSQEGPVIMFFHGNGSAVYSNAHIFKDLMAQGYGVLSVSYPGYPHKDMHITGRNGKPSQSAILGIVLQSYNYLIDEENINPEHIVYMGTSLGAGVAAQLAAVRSPVLLIMDAPFNSMLDMVKLRVPFIPHNLLLKDKYRSDKALQNYDGPMIWMHGTADGVIPIAEGQKLYEGYQGPKTAHIIEGGHHSNLWVVGGREVVLERLAQMFPSG